MKFNRELILNKYDGRCAYCGCELNLKTMQVDHISCQFESKLTKDELHHIDNLNPACNMCNYYKQDFSIEQFREQFSFLITRLKKVFIFRLCIKYNLIQFKENNEIKFYYETKN